MDSSNDYSRFKTSIWVTADYYHLVAIQGWKIAGMDVVIGPGETFLTQVRSGQPSMVWVWIWKISPKNIKCFNFFPSGSKKISSGRVKGGSAPYLLWVKSMLRSGHGWGLNRQTTLNLSTQSGSFDTYFDWNWESHTFFLLSLGSITFLKLGRCTFLLNIKSKAFPKFYPTIEKGFFLV